jgi:hypothetical protein
VEDAGSGLSQSALLDIPVGYGPVVSLSTNEVSFSPLTVGSMSLPMTVLVSNTAASGSAPLTISSVELYDDATASFSQTNNCGTIASGGSCTVNITCDPSQAGGLTTTIRIVSNAESSPDQVYVNGTGNPGP